MSEMVGKTVLGDSRPDEEAKPSDTNSKKNIDIEQIIKNENISSCSLWEIEEECCEVSSSIYEERLLASIEEVASLEDHDDVVYVGVGNGNSSMDALVWMLSNVVAINDTGTLVFLIHVFPETRSIPTPLGKMPISQVNPQHKETYLNQERSKRRDFLQKFLNLCSDSKVKVDTILVESDFEAKALLDLIPILNIRKLVLGTAKSGLGFTRQENSIVIFLLGNMKLRSRKGKGIADQVLQNAPEYCEIKVICEGELVDTMAESLSRSSSSSQREAVVDPIQTPNEVPNAKLFGCNCFKSNAIG